MVKEFPISMTHEDTLNCHDQDEPLLPFPQAHAEAVALGRFTYHYPLTGYIFYHKWIGFYHKRKGFL